MTRESVKQVLDQHGIVYHITGGDRFIVVDTATESGYVTFHAKDMTLKGLLYWLGY